MLRINKIDQELRACEQELRTLRMQSGELVSGQIRQGVVDGMMAGVTARPVRPAALASGGDLNAARSRCYTYVNQLHAYAMTTYGVGDARFARNDTKTRELDWVEAECVNAIDEFQGNHSAFDLGMDGSPEICQKLGEIEFLWRQFGTRR